jgi:hypothetical protein
MTVSQGFHDRVKLGITRTKQQNHVFLPLSSLPFVVGADGRGWRDVTLSRWEVLFVMAGLCGIREGRSPQQRGRLAGRQILWVPLFACHGQW